MTRVLVTAMRHGIAHYKQKEVSLAEASDLTPEGVIGAELAVGLLLSEITTDELIEIRASPYGRTLQTANIVFTVLQRQGYRFSQIDSEVPVIASNVIHVDRDIDEVRNFDLKLFRDCLFGGDLISQSVGNPRNLDFSTYFNTRAWRDTTLSDAVKSRLDMIEYPQDTRERFTAKLQQIAEAEYRISTRVILVTHQGLMNELSDAEVHPADFFTVDPSDFL